MLNIRCPFLKYSKNFYCGYLLSDQISCQDIENCPKNYDSHCGKAVYFAHELADNLKYFNQKL